MDRAKAVKKIKRYQRLSKLLLRKRTAASVRSVETSYGPVRVLEYGFDDKDVKPLFVDIHGGGYAFMSPEHDEKLNLKILERTNVKIISIDYPKAPQHPYPAGIEATYEVIRHYYENASEYCIDSNNIGVGGHSSGGNFATVTCMKAKERKDVEIKYQILVYPGTDAATDPYTRPKCKKGLSNKMIEMIVLSYVEDLEQTRSPYVSPVLATNDQLTGLPKALVILAGDGDPLTPEGRVYAENMRRAGVNVELHEFADTLHGFVHKRSPDAEKAMDLIIDFINNENAA